MAEYKDTLNLPKTKMPQRAGLAQMEPKLAEILPKIYQNLLEKNKNNQPFILHDGPPYPNGDIHLGHALNKTLKDIVIKYKAMKGFYTPYIPGWDCHGLPIETQLIKELKKNNETIEDKVEFRERCKQYALQYVNNQREQFRRLGIFADWQHPYLTLQPEYEKEVVALIGDLMEKGYIFKNSKPIHWCANCNTALAEAEIEYANHKSSSIYIKFDLDSQQSVQSPKIIEGDVAQIQKIFTGERSASFIVWTTTPWTLPANVAVAVHPDYIYDIVEDKNSSQVYILAEALQQKISKKLNLEFVNLAKIQGKELQGIITKHPFIERQSPIVTAEYVTAEDGTGCVHIAPGHGQEDYLVGLQFNLPVIMPVDDRGFLTKEAGIFAGLNVRQDANEKIIEHLDKTNKLLKVEIIEHSYPHCWRCQNPVIFRATPQWFIAVDRKDDQGNSIRELGLKAIKDTKWYPAWGQNRITAMVETRPDWCISRQRSWGIPIPVLYCKECEKPQLKKEFINKVAEIIGQEGTNAWFKKAASAFVPQDAKCDCGCSEFEKETDILDVWVESGASQRAVLRKNSYYQQPIEQADLYLEGSDQHRGWFQSSLLLSVGETQHSPFKQVLTHGFTIDDKGRKMSKSLGNVISVDKTIQQYGADILRLWVASTDFKNDLAVADSILKQVQDAFLKIRNTLRFLMSNLYDYKAGAQVLEIDQWLLLKLDQLVMDVDQSYQEFEFHKIFHKVHDFCVNDLSALQMDFNKDNLYCNAAASIERRSTQQAFYIVLKTLLQILAPIITFSVEDTWQYLAEIAKNAGLELPESALLAGFPEVKTAVDLDSIEKFNKILTLREQVNIELEKLRKEKVIAASLEAQVTIYTKEKFDVKDLARIFIVSKVSLIEADDFRIEVQKAQGEKCERCWRYEEDLQGNLCQRCSQVVQKY